MTDLIALLSLWVSIVTLVLWLIFFVPKKYIETLFNKEIKRYQNDLDLKLKIFEKLSNQNNSEILISKRIECVDLLWLSIKKIDQNVTPLNFITSIFYPHEYVQIEEKDKIINFDTNSSIVIREDVLGLIPYIWYESWRLFEIYRIVLYRSILKYQKEWQQWKYDLIWYEDQEKFLNYHLSIEEISYIKKSPLWSIERFQQVMRSKFYNTFEKILDWNTSNYSDDKLHATLSKLWSESIIKQTSTEKNSKTDYNSGLNWDHLFISYGIPE